MSRPVVGRVERGDCGTVPVGVIERIVASVGGSLDVAVRWNGEGLDRLLDEAHARIVEQVVARMRALDWQVAVEVSFSRYGERGSIDVLAWHPTRHALAVFEVKSVTPDLQAMLVGIDRKGRLAPEIARERGWVPVSGAARILVLADTSTNRRRLRIFDAIVQACLPAGTLAIRHWLEDPVGPPPSGVWFLANDHGAAPIRPNTKRVRLQSPRPRSDRGRGSTR